MEYKFSDQQNYEDFSSGRVFYQKPGMTNFPVRLMNEIFLRCISYSNQKDNIVLYDPCCGGGYLVTVLGMLHRNRIKKIYGSDISTKAIEIAKMNGSLLTDEGLERRQSEITTYYHNFGKDSHRIAIQSCENLKIKYGGYRNEAIYEFFQADATRLSDVSCMDQLPDIIMVDVPYGHLVEWSQPCENMMDRLLNSLMVIAKIGTVIAICSDKHQKLQLKVGVRKEKQLIGKRKFEILIKE